MESMMIKKKYLK